MNHISKLGFCTTLKRLQVNDKSLIIKSSVTDRCVTIHGCNKPEVLFKALASFEYTHYTENEGEIVLLFIE